MLEANGLIYLHHVYVIGCFVKAAFVEPLFVPIGCGLQKRDAGMVRTQCECTFHHFPGTHIHTVQDSLFAHIVAACVIHSRLSVRLTKP